MKQSLKLEKINNIEGVYIMTQTETKTKTNVKFKPLGNRVLVKRLEQEEKLKGGIILPDAAKKKQEQE